MRGTLERRDDREAVVAFLAGVAVVGCLGYCAGRARGETPNVHALAWPIVCTVTMDQDSLGFTAEICNVGTASVSDSQRVWWRLPPKARQAVLVASVPLERRWAWTWTPKPGKPPVTAATPWIAAVVTVALPPGGSISVKVRATPSPDLDSSGAVDGRDLAVMLGQWGGTGAADLNLDGTVDGADEAILLGAFTH